MAGIGCGGCGFEAQALSSSASGGKACFIIIGGPFVEGALLGGDAVGVGLVGGAGILGGRSIVGHGGGEARLLSGVELLEVAALLLPMAGVVLLYDEQKSEDDRGREPGDPLRIEEAEQSHGCSSASM